MLAILHISYDRLRGSYEFLRLFPRVSPERPRNTYFDLMQIQYKNRWFRASAFRELWEWPTSYNMKTRDWLVFRNIFFWFISTPFSNIVSKYTNKTTSFEILYILAIYPFLKNGFFSDSGIKTLLLLFSCTVYENNSRTKTLILRSSCMFIFTKINVFHMHLTCL